MGAGVLPIAIHNKQVYLLLGKEAGSGGLSLISVEEEKNESHLETAIRESVKN